MNNKKGKNKNVIFLWFGKCFFEWYVGVNNYLILIIVVNYFLIILCLKVEYFCCLSCG